MAGEGGPAARAASACWPPWQTRIPARLPPSPRNSSTQGSVAAMAATKVLPPACPRSLRAARAPTRALCPPRASRPGVCCAHLRSQPFVLAVFLEFQSEADRDEFLEAWRPLAVWVKDNEPGTLRWVRVWVWRGSLLLRPRRWRHVRIPPARARTHRRPRPPP